MARMRDKDTIELEAIVESLQQEGILTRAKSRLGGVAGAVKGIGTGIKGAIQSATGSLVNKQSLIDTGNNNIKSAMGAGDRGKKSSYISATTDDIVNDMSTLFSIDITDDQQKKLSQAIESLFQPIAYTSIDNVNGVKFPNDSRTGKPVPKV